MPREVLWELCCASRKSRSAKTGTGCRTERAIVTARIKRSDLDYLFITKLILVRSTLLMLHSLEVILIRRLYFYSLFRANQKPHVTLVGIQTPRVWKRLSLQH
jgi:hypothetical protein